MNLLDGLVTACYICREHGRDICNIRVFGTDKVSGRIDGGPSDPRQLIFGES